MHVSTKDGHAVKPTSRGCAGVYPISLLVWAFGHEEPTEVQAMAVMHPDGTPDVAGSAQLRFARLCEGLSLL